MKGVTIFLGLAGQMISDCRNFKTSVVAYTAAKGYKDWPDVINFQK